MTVPITASDMASGNGNRVGNAMGESNAQTGPRARARSVASVPVTESDPQGAQVARRVADAGASAGRVIVDDFRNAWPWRGQAPSVMDHLAAKPERHRVAAGSTWLYAPWVAYHYGVALPVLAVLSTVMWLVQHPMRVVPAVVVVLLLAAMWT